MTEPTKKKRYYPPEKRYAANSELLWDVLRLIAEGNSNAEIGQRLFVSEDTVKMRTVALYKRLGARDRAHAVSIGYQRGLLKITPDAGVS